MGKFVDFIVGYDDDPTIMGRRILRNLIVSRLKNKKPCIIFIGGDSGEGKSITGIVIMEIINEAYGVVIDVENQIIYTPPEYADKINKILFDPKFKKYRVIQMDEAREVVKAKLWHSFVNQALADIQAMMRTVKRIAVIVVSQFIKDIDKDIRHNITYYIKVVRPMGKRTRMTIYRVWKDDRDLERPVLRKRKIKGFIIKDGRRIMFTPTYIEVKMPDEKVCEAYEQLNLRSKTAIIKRKLQAILKEIEKELGDPTQKVDLLVNYYLSNPESVHLVLKKVRGKLQLRPEVRKIHDLTVKEAEKFKEDLLDGLANKGLMSQLGGIT